MQTTDLLKLFQTRDDTYHESTEVIAKELDFVFEAIIEALEVNVDTIKWEEMRIFESSLMLIAKVDGGDADNTVKIVTVGIPLAVIEQQSKEVLLKFLLANKTTEDMLARGNDNHGSDQEEESEHLDYDSMLAPPKTLELKETLKDYLARGTTEKRTVH